MKVTVNQTFFPQFLMTTTTIGSGILTLFLGVQLTFHYAPHWFTLALIYSFCFIYTLGVREVPFVLAAEVFLPEVILYLCQKRFFFLPFIPFSFPLIAQPEK
jgi:hypothetical protein